VVVACLISCIRASLSSVSWLEFWVFAALFYLEDAACD
jgi:hypothetical protein